MTTAMNYKVIGSSDEGMCDRCGKEGLKRTVAVVACDADGAELAGEEHWGVCCAAYAKFGSKSYASQNKIVAEAMKADAAREYDVDTRVARIATGLIHTYREMFPVSHTETITFDCLKAAANYKYRLTGRGLAGSYFASNTEGHIVRVDGSDAVDVAFYSERGFKQVTTAVAA